VVLPPPPSARKVRKHLSADALYALIREDFGADPEAGRQRQERLRAECGTAAVAEDIEPGSAGELPGIQGV